MRYEVMTGRYACRIRDQLTGRVDSRAYRDWEEAYRLAAELNAEYDDSGGRRDPVTVRRFDPPKKVEILTNLDHWRSGVLSYWIRQPEGWYGYARMDIAAHWHWLPPYRLRPTKSDGGVT